ncbi:uncharacterized protein [Zea mays]|uniref:uncharacterized protein LOC103639206 n=1 Tax=Zea mays TaxID=4577 RepID=UPI0002210FAD|nr:uncharacterized protein LOC103639206 [Zea mays]XP_035818294.1 uncharacterized protein LOC103639206 isoform X1 [Zea mays]|eukprot:NP_001315512.1 uncharacterized protein LOC103639206 [Zea mays]
MEGTMKHSNVVTERSSVTKPREQEVSAWHDEAGERLVWTPRAAVQLMLHA